jgi:hypothetical protein
MGRIANVLAVIVAQDQNLAQLFFLIAVIVAAVGLLFGVIPLGRPYAWAIGAFGLLVLLFVSLGLLVGS